MASSKDFCSNESKSIKVHKVLTHNILMEKIRKYWMEIGEKSGKIYGKNGKTDSEHLLQQSPKKKQYSVVTCTPCK